MTKLGTVGGCKIKRKKMCCAFDRRQAQRDAIKKSCVRPVRCIANTLSLSRAARLDRLRRSASVICRDRAFHRRSLFETRIRQRGSKRGRFRVEEAPVLAHANRRNYRRHRWLACLSRRAHFSCDPNRSAGQYASFTRAGRKPLYQFSVHSSGVSTWRTEPSSNAMLMPRSWRFMAKRDMS